MISSTKPSSPTKACSRLDASTSVSSFAAHCSRNCSGSRPIWILSVIIEEGVCRQNYRNGSLLNLHTQQLQDTLQLVVTEKSDFQGAFSLAVSNLDFRSKPLAKSVFNIANMRVTRRRNRPSLHAACRSSSGLFGLQPRD